MRASEKNSAKGPPPSRKTVLSFLTRIRYLRTHRWSDVDVAFIVSSGRTGTAFLGQFFKVYPQVHAVHEPQPDMFDLGILKIRHVASPRKLQRKMLLNRQEQHQLLKDTQKTTYIESNPFLALLISELAELYPHAKFVFVTRDYPSYVLSAYNKSPDGSNRVYMYSSDDHRQRLTPCDTHETRYCKEWESWGRHEKISWYWKMINSLLLDDLRGVKQVLRLNYEDFFHGERGFEACQKLLRFLSLPELQPGMFQAAVATRVNANPVKIASSYRDLPPLSNLTLKDEIRALRERMGYRPVD